MATIPPTTPDTINPGTQPQEAPPQPNEPMDPPPPETAPTPPDIDKPGHGPDEIPPEFGN